MGLIKTFKLGAQPVIDGVMIRGRNKYAISMKKSNGNVLLDKNRINFISNMPIIFIRGIISVVESGILGLKSVLFSANYFDNEVKNEGDDLVTSKAEMLKLEDEKRAEEAQSWLKYFGILFLLVLGVILFFVLPPIIASNIFDNSDNIGKIYFGLVEGAIRLVLYVVYLAIFKLLPGKAQSFRQYHAAEHKAINCFERKKELTIEKLKEESSFHPRDGFLILFYTIIISSVAFAFLLIDNLILAILLRITVLLLSIGVAYEISRFFGMFNGKFSRGLNMILGMWIEIFTVDEPDEIQNFIALTALKTAMTEEE